MKTGPALKSPRREGARVTGLKARAPSWAINPAKRASRQWSNIPGLGSMSASACYPQSMSGAWPHCLPNSLYRTKMPSLWLQIDRHHRRKRPRLQIPTLLHDETGSAAAQCVKVFYHVHLIKVP